MFATQIGQDEGMGDAPEGWNEGLRLEERFCACLHAWDRHVDSCPVCLTEGMERCGEGQDLSDAIASARGAIQALEFRALAETGRPSLSVLQRAWIGWVALIAPITG